MATFKALAAGIALLAALFCGVYLKDGMKSPALAILGISGIIAVAGALSAWQQRPPRPISLQAAMAAGDLVRCKSTGKEGVVESFEKDGSPKVKVDGGATASTMNAKDCDIVKKAVEPDEEDKRLLDNMHKLRSCYSKYNAFPRWVIESYAVEHLADYKKDASQCTIFYDEGCSPSIVLKLATHREPVNIGMNRRYNQDKLQEQFGWRTGLYGKLAGHTQDGLAGTTPNIAIMCPTPVVSALKGCDVEAGDKQLEEIQKTDERAYILSVIGYAFDSPAQPDQQYFLGSGSCAGRISDAKHEELAKCFERIFDKVFAAAIHHRREVVVLSKFGTAAFSVYFPGNVFLDIWMPAFQTSLEAWADLLRESNVKELSLMGGGTEADFKKFIEGLGFLSKVYSFFPDPIRSELGSKFASSMFVNAWDPWSIIGNGNFEDASLDGYVGRTTALSVLGWPLTNPYLEANRIPVARPKSRAK